MSSTSDRRKRAATVSELVQQLAVEASGKEALRRNSSVASVVGREHLFLEQLEECLGRVVAKLPKSSRVATPKVKREDPVSRILNAAISDTHFGAALDPREVGHPYGPLEEARRLAKITLEIADYKIDHRDETELYVHLLGDIIQGVLHDMRDGLPLAEQVSVAVWLLLQSISYLAGKFRKVTVFCTPGNHGRNTARHRDRAVNQKWDSIETIIYYSLSAALKKVCPNVRVVMSYEPKYDFELFGAVGFATHGDTVLNPGYPGKSIDISGIKRQVNEINNARIVKKENPYSLFVVGHVHVGSQTHLPGGAVILTNGCLIPPDAYATSIGIFNTACGQWIWESVKGHPIGDSRFVVVDGNTDKDASLDKIIKPWTGFPT